MLLGRGQRDAIRARHIGTEAVQSTIGAQPIDASSRIGNAGLPLVSEVEVAVGGEVQVVQALKTLAVCGFEYRFQSGGLWIKHQQSLLVSAMKARPSLWNLSPLGQPASGTTRSHSFCGEIRKIRPNGMSTIQRLASRSNDGPSRKHSTSTPWRLGSDQAVRLLLRNFLGMDVKTSALISVSGLNGLSMDAASFFYVGIASE